MLIPQQAVGKITIGVVERKVLTEIAVLNAFKGGLGLKADTSKE